MGKAIVIAGLLMALLMFGCLGGLKGQQDQAGQQTQAGQGASVPSTAAGASGVGDSDISPSQDENEGTLPDEDLLPQPPDAGADASTGTGVDASGLADELSDSFSDSEEFPELISEDVILEPA